MASTRKTNSLPASARLKLAGQSSFNAESNRYAPYYDQPDAAVRHLFCYHRRALLSGVPSRAQTVYPEAPEADKLVTQARTKAEAKDFLGAEALLDRAIRLDPNDPNGWNERGFVRMTRGVNFDGAIADYTSCLVRMAILKISSPLKAPIFSNRAQAWLQKDEPLRAFVDAFIACKLDETCGIAWLSRADAIFALGNADEAKSCIERARKLDPNLPVRSYTAEGAKQKAAGRVSPDDKADITAAFAQALAFEKDYDHAKAVAAYDSIIALRPLTTEAWDNRGLIHLDLGHYAEAFADFSIAMTLSGLAGNKDLQVNCLRDRAILYANEARYAEAVSDLELAVQIKPTDALSLARLKTANERVAEVAHLLPANAIVQAKELVAKAYSWTGEYGEEDEPQADALLFLDNLVTQQPDNALAWLLRGDMEQIDGGDCAALYDYDTALRLDPMLANAYGHRGMRLLLREKSMEARATADLEKAVALKSSDPEVYLKLAFCRLGVKDRAGALALLQQGLAIDPKHKGCLEERADLLKKP